LNWKNLHFYKHSFKIYPRNTVQANNFHSDDPVKATNNRIW